jgi:hypothetical protein
MFKCLPAMAMWSVLAATTLLGLLLVSPTAHGQDYTVEAIQGAPDTDEVSAEVRALMADQGVRVKRGSRAAVEIWLLKEWTIDAEFEQSDQRLYPFVPGQLVGLAHFGRRGSEFRDQQVESGWYTMRFGLQPVDGNHEGTSPTRDFLLLVKAGQDSADKQWDEKELHKASAEAAGATHPAMLCLQLPEEQGESPSIRHDEATDWWILRALGKGVAANQAPQEIPIELVVVGHASE